MAAAAGAAGMFMTGWANEQDIVAAVCRSACIYLCYAGRQIGDTSNHVKLFMANQRG